MKIVNTNENVVEFDQDDCCVYFFIDRFKYCGTTEDIYNIVVGSEVVNKELQNGAFKDV